MGRIMETNVSKWQDKLSDLSTSKLNKKCIPCIIHLFEKQIFRNKTFRHFRRIFICRPI